MTSRIDTTRTERLAAALAERGADAYVAVKRPNQLYLLAEHHDDPSTVISRANCGAILFHGDDVVVFPGVWISNACRDLLAGCEVVPNDVGDPPPHEQLATRLGALGLKRVLFDSLSADALTAVTAAAPGTACAEEDFVTTELRRHKDARDIAGMRQAAMVADLGMQTAFACLRPGGTCAEAIAEGTAAMLRAGAESVAMAPASGIGTYYLDSGEDPRREIAEGDMVFIDMGIWVHGYLGDMTRAGIVGEGSPEKRELLHTVQEAYRLASSAMVPGARAADIYQSVVDLYATKGWEQYFVHHISHGLGLGGDLPRVARGGDMVLQAGDALSCEPGCYVPGLGGARVENMILVTDDGPEELTRTPIDPAMGS
jgi:Xaa-Pro aminopeptidase